MALKQFEVPQIALKLMNENRSVKGFGLQARQYFTLVVIGNDPIYVRCTADVWWQDNKICTTIDKIALYETFLEYETERVKDLSGAYASDNPNIN